MSHRKALSSFPFVAIDGEGLNVRNRHRYRLLSAADELGRPLGAIENAAGLGSRQALDWLLSLAYPDTGRPIKRAFAFGFGYDAAMILRELPPKPMGLLVRPELRANGTGGHAPVFWQPERAVRYKLNYLRNKWLFQRQRWDAAERTWTVEAKVTVWDIADYFAAPFVTALADFGVADAATRARIGAMKERRRAFAKADWAEVRAYNQLEVVCLAQLVRRLQNLFAGIGLHLSRYHGPGTVAAMALRSLGAHRFK